MFRKLFVLLFFSIALSVIGFAQSPTSTKLDSIKKVAAIENKLAKQYANSPFTALITKVNMDQFGYFIFCNRQLLIDQKTFQLLQETKAFTAKPIQKR